ncbi:MAG: hypothetical protein IH987_20790, partial [Planctomycetes bacterium]|nr:hypothetical protein [Planctomycetota bacterium]
MVALDLQPFHIAGADTQFVLGRRGQPDRPIAFDPASIMLFRGEVRGVAGSHVFLALGDSLATGYVDLGPGRRRYQISTKGRLGQPLDAGHISVFEPVNATNLPPGVPLCGVEGDHLLPGTGTRGIEVPPITDTSVRIAAPTVGLKHLELAIETDYEFYEIFNDVDATATYIAQLYAALSSIYIREMQAYFHLTFVRVWDEPGTFPYPSTLSAFRDYWNSNMGHVDRDVAQYFSGHRDVPVGGVAWLNALCSNYAYSWCGYAMGRFGNPDIAHILNRDVMVTAHELGHKHAAWERWLSRVVLAPVAYGHFFVEHNRGHHRRVATPEDPASARLGESFWAFLPRTVLGS